MKASAFRALTAAVKWKVRYYSHMAYKPSTPLLVHELLKESELIADPQEIQMLHDITNIEFTSTQSN